MVSNLETQQILVVVTVLLVFKFIVTNMLSGGKKVRAPEDNLKFLSDEENREENDPLSVTARWRRIVMNDLENIPLTLILLWVSFACQGP
eukprot:UN20252